MNSQELVGVARSWWEFPGVGVNSLELPRVPRCWCELPGVAESSSQIAGITGISTELLRSRGNCDLPLKGLMGSNGLHGAL